MSGVNSGHRLAGRACGLAISFALALGWALASPADAQTLTVRPKVKVGDTIDLTLTKSLRRERPNQQPVFGSSETPIKITVLETKGEGIVLNWVAGPTKVLSSSQPLDPLAQRMIDLAQGVIFELQLDAEGRFRQLRNFEGAKAALESSLEGALQILPDEGKRQQLRDNVQRIFATRAGLEQTALREAMVYLYPFGHTMEVGKPDVRKLSVRTPFDKEPIAALRTVSLLSVGEPAGRAKLSWSQQLDPVAASATVRRMAEEVMRQSGKELPKEAQLPRLVVSDEGTAELVVETGFAALIEYERRVELQDNLEHQTVKLVRQP